MQSVLFVEKTGVACVATGVLVWVLLGPPVANHSILPRSGARLRARNISGKNNLGGVTGDDEA